MCMIAASEPKTCYAGKICQLGCVQYVDVLVLLC